MRTIGDKMCRVRHSCLDAYESSPYLYAYRIIIYRCEALDVIFPMELKPSHLDIYSSSIEFLFPKSPSLLQSDHYRSFSYVFILAPFTFFGHFQSNSNLSRPETLEQTHQGSVQGRTCSLVTDRSSIERAMDYRSQLYLNRFVD
ncbi:hypothetical protein PIB30_062228 [Stylosanthes scabra]|uniref:Uncharacterized protein n=1 Tax=Stylosanthes scabra TaxID=79078 RepID=A0ABU6SL73_9FABA|nr:hypothetical protein [Stylosanthes scabra]